MISHHPVIYVVTKINGDSVVEKLPTAPLQEFTTADGIQHLIDKNGYDDDDDD